MLHADKKVTNSQWCHSQKWESACLQLLSCLINSGPGLFDGKRAAKQKRFMKLVSIAPVYFIFKALCFRGTHLPLFCSSTWFQSAGFHTLCLRHLSLCTLLTCTQQGSANGSQAHICHTSPLSRQADMGTFPAHHTAGLPNLNMTAGTKEGKKEDEILLRESIKGWTRSIYHYSFGGNKRIAVIEFLRSFQMLAQNNLTRFGKKKDCSVLSV